MDGILFIRQLKPPKQARAGRPLWVKSDSRALQVDVRFTLESGHEQVDVAGLNRARRQAENPLDALGKNPEPPLVAVACSLMTNEMKDGRFGPGTERKKPTRV